MNTLIKLLLIIFLLRNNVALGKEVSVTTYVTRVQEERHSTRWTLTEWLRIKERMKMMDVWLAMFSNPEKDRFQPELNATWLVTRSAIERKDPVLGVEGLGAGYTGRSQVWLTNLLSSSLGVRSLNIDFGVEAGQHSSGKLTSQAINSSSLMSTTTWYTGNFRLWGKNIQDSSLVLKYGLLQSNNTLYANEKLNPDGSKFNASNSGTMVGGELQLYLINWLGGEGTYHRYMPMKIATTRLEGNYFESMAFIEISVLRFMAGRYQEYWSRNDDAGGKTSTRETGYLAGLKLQI